MINKVLFIGLGSAGRAVIEAANCEGLQGEVLLIDTGKKSLNEVRSHQVFIIGQKLLKGLGTGGALPLGKKAIDESFDDLLCIVKDYSHIVLIAGLNGGLGGGVAHLAEKLLRHSLAVSVSAIPPHYFETSKASTDKVIFQLNQLRHELLFLNIHKVDKDLVASNRPLSEYLDKFNLNLITKTIALAHQ
jgi:cell division GTPase FtsZ